MYITTSVLTAAFALLSQCNAANIYVSPNGSGSGSQTSPFGSIQSAVTKAVAGDTIYLRGGTYAPSANIQVGKSGSSSKRYTVRPFGSEKVIIDGRNMPGCVSKRSQPRH